MSAFPPAAARGFTLVELTVALVLLALMASILFGSLSLAGRSLDGGERKAAETSGMRLAQEFLRGQLEAAQPLRMRKVAEFPLLFGGEKDELRFAAAPAARTAGAGVWYYRLAVVPDGDRSPVVLQRTFADVNAAEVPQFADAEGSVLVPDAAELRLAYLGRDALADASVAPTWRDRWDNRQLLPLLVRIDVTPKSGAPWPPLIVAPRQGPEAGCRSFDGINQRCLAP